MISSATFHAPTAPGVSMGTGGGRGIWRRRKGCSSPYGSTGRGAPTAERHTRSSLKGWELWSSTHWTGSGRPWHTSASMDTAPRASASLPRRRSAGGSTSRPGSRPRRGCSPAGRRPKRPSRTSLRSRRSRSAGLK